MHDRLNAPGPILLIVAGTLILMALLAYCVGP